jgi:hypothetical protein
MNFLRNALNVEQFAESNLTTRCYKLGTVDKWLTIIQNASEKMESRKEIWRDAVVYIPAKARLRQARSWLPHQD